MTSERVVDVNESNTLCALAYGGINISTDGSNKPCCSMLHTGNLNPPPWSADHMKTEWWQDLIHNLENGIKDQRCHRCWELEKAGNKSLRLSSNHYLKDGELTLHPWSHVDLKLGSKCNLMCVMCSGSASSLIAKELWENKDERWLARNNFYEELPKIKRWYEQAGYTEKLQWWQDPKFYDKLKSNAEHIRTLKFTGGEPTLIPQVMEVIDYMLETRHSEHIKIVITTNGTYKGTDIYEKMCRFKSAKVNLSVDGTGDVYNYIRYPHTWKRWENNTKKLVELCKGYQGKIKIGYQFTTSVFNLFNIREMEDWILTTGGYDNGVTVNYHANYVFNPKWLNIRYLPWDTLDRAVLYLKDGHKISKAIIRFIWGSDDISDEEKAMQMEKLKYDTELKDRIRVKRPNWDTIDNDMLRLKDIMYGEQ